MTHSASPLYFKRCSSGRAKAGLVAVDHSCPPCLSSYFMDLSEAWSQKCICGHVFPMPQEYSLHYNSCTKSKKWLGTVLGQAREVQEIKKCCKAEAKLAPTETETTGPSPYPTPVELHLIDRPLPGTHHQVGDLISESPSILMFICVCQVGEAPMDDEDLNWSLAECRMHCVHCQMPKHYQDIAPEAPAMLPPSLQIMSEAEPGASRPSASPARKILKSSRNIFGLFCQYYAALPSSTFTAHIQTSLHSC